MRVRVYQDGEEIAFSDTPLIQTIEAIYPKAIRRSANAVSIAFTGIALVDDMAVISLPKGQDMTAIREDSNLLRHIALLSLRSIVKYKVENPLEASGDEAFDDGFGSQKLYYALQIIDDYLSNGLVNRMRTVIATSAGSNIAWQRTITRSMASHSSSGVLYQRPYSRTREIDSKDPLRLVQAHIVKECFDIIGWLFFSKEPVELRQATLNKSGTDLLAILAQEKVTTFSQRELRLIDLLSAYLSNSSFMRGKERVVLFGTLNYERVWECACKVAFHDCSALQSILVPQPEWHRESGLTGLLHEKRARQIPDILSIHESILLVLDAKYYDTSVSLPGWQDTVKQIYYQDTIERKLDKQPNLRNRLNIEGIANAFLFPGDSFGSIGCMGYVHIPSLDDSNRWGLVDAYVVDLPACLEAYLKNLPRWDWIGLIGARNRALSC